MSYLDQDRAGNGEFGNKRYTSDAVSLPADISYLDGLRPRVDSMKSSFLDAFREDPSDGLIQRWRDDLLHVDQLEKTDPLRYVSPGDQQALLAFIDEVARRRLRHASRTDLDVWEPGEDVDTDGMVLQELAGIVGDNMELSGYAPGEDVDADELVSDLISSHRAFSDGFPQR